MQIESNARSGSYYGGNGRPAVQPPSGQDGVQSAAPQSRVGGDQNVMFPSQTEIGLRTPSAALASAMWQMMIRRSYDNTEDRLII